jgi:hypothetical protein
VRSPAERKVSWAVVVHDPFSRLLFECRTEGAMGGNDDVERHHEESQQDEPRYHRRIDFKFTREE